jgi:uncharacterized membrane protein YgcG
MKSITPFRTASPVILAALVLAGCHAPRSDMNVAAVADSSVVVDPPLVKIDHSDGIATTVISGTVHRQPNVGGVLTGRIDIDFVDPDGERIDTIKCDFVPSKVPVDPNTAAAYMTRDGELFPTGTTVRVRYVDSTSALREDVDGMDYTGGPWSGKGGGAHSHGGGGHGGGGGGKGW